MFTQQPTNKHQKRSKIALLTLKLEAGVQIGLIKLHWQTPSNTASYGSAIQPVLQSETVAAHTCSCLLPWGLSEAVKYPNGQVVQALLPGPAIPNCSISTTHTTYPLGVWHLGLWNQGQASWKKRNTDIWWEARNNRVRSHNGDRGGHFSKRVPWFSGWEPTMR